MITVGDNASIKNCLMNGIPVLIAMGIYSSFEHWWPGKTGIVSLPTCIKYNDPNDPNDPFLGGHEVLIVGFNEFTASFTFLNSWGTGYGNGGYGYLPFSYVGNPYLTYSLYYLNKK